MFERMRYPVLLAALGALAYSNGLWGDWCYDDRFVIVECREIESFSGLRYLFSDEYGPRFRELSFRPMATLTYFVDGAVFGKSSFLSRLLNLLLHVAAGLLLYNLWRTLFGREVLAFLAAGIFLCHPLTTEAVNSPGFREEVLCLLLTLAALRLALPALLAPEVGRSAAYGSACAVVWLLALLSKEPAFMLVALGPVALFHCPRVREAFAERARRSWLRVGALGILFGLSFAVFLALYLTFSYSGVTGADRPGGGGGPALGFLNFCRTFLIYGRLWLVPVGLSTGHYFEASTSFGDARLWAGLVVFSIFVFVSGLCFFARSRDREWMRLAGTGGVWALAALAPVMQIVPTPQLIAERYVYMAHAGWALSAAAILTALGDRGLRGRAWTGLVVVLLASLTCLTMVRNRDWRDNVTLNIRRYEGWPNAEGRAALGALHFLREEYETSRRYLLEALAMDPEHADAHRNLGVLLLREGRFEESRGHLERALELAPENELNRKALERLGSIEE